MYEFCIIPGMIFCINTILLYKDVMNSLQWQDTRVERLEHMVQYLTELMDTEVIQKRTSSEIIPIDTKETVYKKND
jgi:hypothetical protein